MRWIALPLALTASACFWGDEFEWASREEIVLVATACGVEGFFTPTKAGSAWAAYVPETEPNAKVKEDCIYKTFEKHGILVTR
jgi:hypothetical protein